MSKPFPFYAWLAMIFLCAVAGSCEQSKHHPAPQHVDNGAVRHSAKGVLNDL